MATAQPTTSWKEPLRFRRMYGPGFRVSTWRTGVQGKPRRKRGDLGLAVCLDLQAQSGPRSPVQVPHQLWRRELSQSPVTALQDEACHEAQLESSGLAEERAFSAHPAGESRYHRKWPGAHSSQEEAELQGLFPARHGGHCTVPQANGHWFTGVAPSLHSGKALPHPAGQGSRGQALGM